MKAKVMLAAGLLAALMAPASAQESTGFLTRLVVKVTSQAVKLAANAAGNALKPAAKPSEDGTAGTAPTDGQAQPAQPLPTAAVETIVGGTPMQVPASLIALAQPDASVSAEGVVLKAQTAQSIAAKAQADAAAITMNPDEMPKVPLAAPGLPGVGAVAVGVGSRSAVAIAAQVAKAGASDPTQYMLRRADLPVKRGFVGSLLMATVRLAMASKAASKLAEGQGDAAMRSGKPGSAGALVPTGTPGPETGPQAAVPDSTADAGQ